MLCIRILLVALITLLAHGHLYAQEPLTKAQMAEDVRQLIDVTRSAYAYVAEKKADSDVDLDRILDRAMKQLESVQSNSEFHDVLLEAVAALKDGHCAISPGNVEVYRPFAWPFTLAAVKEGVAVLDVRQELGADAGIVRGDLILQVNGRPIEDWITGSMRKISASSDGARRRFALERMRITMDKSIEVSLRRPSGVTATLTLPTLKHADPAPSSGKFIEVRPLSPQVSYMRLPAFYWPDKAFQNAANDEQRDLALAPLRREFAAAFERVAGADSLVLDLRGNVGGNDLIGQLLVSHFLPQDFTYYHSQTRSSPELKKLPGFDYVPATGWAEKFNWKPRRTRYTFFKGQPYRGKLCVLIDEGCFSVTDCVTACLADLHRDVRFVGRPTHGGSGGPTRLATLKHSNVDLYLCIMRIWSPKGRLIEGHGTQPDVPVQWTRDDILHGRDPDLAAALAQVE